MNALAGLRARYRRYRALRRAGWSLGEIRQGFACRASGGIRRDPCAPWTLAGAAERLLWTAHGFLGSVQHGIYRLCLLAGRARLRALGFEGRNPGAVMQWSCGADAYAYESAAPFLKYERYWRRPEQAWPSHMVTTPAIFASAEPSQ